MRRPSTYAEAYRWWRDALAGREVERHDGIPECGFYRMRNVKGGPWVPVKIVLERDIDPDTGELMGPERYIAEYDGKRSNAFWVWGRVSPISREEYDRLVAAVATNETMAANMVPVDLSEKPTLPPRRSR